MPGEHIGITDEERRAVFDLFCETNDGRKIIIEMQRANQLYFVDRSVFYLSFPIRQQAKKGKKWNYELRSVYSISLLNFSINHGGTDQSDYMHQVQLKNQHNEIFFEKLKVIYLEMPNFTKQLEDLQTDRDRWLFLIKHMPTLPEVPTDFTQPIFKQAFEVARLSKLSKEELMAYERSLKETRDYHNTVEYARMQGKNEGLAMLENERKLKEEAQRQKEEAQRQKETILKVSIRRFRELGLGDQEIAETLGISIEEVQSARTRD